VLALRVTVLAASLSLALLAPHAGISGISAPKRPAIVWKPISFPLARKAEMQAYSIRHYGIRAWRLRHPHVIVEHYTASNSFSSAYSTFNADVPDGELHELPGICAHFVVDKDGTVYQLVPLDVMCRHTVGLNWTAIGIEHVGTSDEEILANPRQLAASLQLTAWLMSEYGIRLGDVIGHNENRTSRFHHERYPAWRCQTHADWQKADMDLYRARLARVARLAGVPLGRPVKTVTPNC